MAETSGPKVRDRNQVRMLRTVLRSGELMLDALKKRLKAEGLSVAEFDTIAALGNTEGLRMKDIAHAMAASSSPSNATRVCISLEKRGLIERHRAPDNDREVIAKLTSQGEQKFNSCFMDIVAFTEQLMDARLSSADQKQVADILDRFLKAD